MFKYPVVLFSQSLQSHKLSKLRLNYPEDRSKLKYLFYKVHIEGICTPQIIPHSTGLYAASFVLMFLWGVWVCLRSPSCCSLQPDPSVSSQLALLRRPR